MTVTSYGHYPASGSWKTNKKLDGTADLKAKAGNHAEQIVYRLLNQRSETTFLITQNAFPCETCHAWFKNSIGTNAVIIKVEGDQGLYSMCHGWGAGAAVPLPQYFFYRNGVATMNPTGVAPGGFPAHPTPTSISYSY